MNDRSADLETAVMASKRWPEWGNPPRSLVAGVSAGQRRKQSDL
jgi:hypothetical protein